MTSWPRPRPTPLIISRDFYFCNLHTEISIPTNFQLNPSILKISSIVYSHLTTRSNSNLRILRTFEDLFRILRTFVRTFMDWRSFWGLWGPWGLEYFEDILMTFLRTLPSPLKYHLPLTTVASPTPAEDNSYCLSTKGSLLSQAVGLCCLVPRPQGSGLWIGLWPMPQFLYPDSPVTHFVTHFTYMWPMWPKVVHTLSPLFLLSWEQWVQVDVIVQCLTNQMRILNFEIVPLFTLNDSC